MIRRITIAALILALLGWMSWDLVFSEHGYLVYRSELAELEKNRAELKALKARRESLAREILRLRNNPKALEELVHNELGYVHSDEFMIILPDREKESGK